MESTGGEVRKIEPEFLGPLKERPLAESARRSAPDDIFPGAEAFLGGRQQKARRRQWQAVQELLGRLLRKDEHVLYCAQGMQIPPGLQGIGLGHLTYAYHQVLLVFTETRLVEVLLNVWGKKPATRIRAYEWKHVQDLTLRFRRLTIKPAQGKKQGWSLQLGGDKKLVALLLPRLKGRMLLEGASAAAPLPVWHCPRCAAANPPNPSKCASCGTVFRSATLAACLSLAFPGAGLLYLGHPALAVFHFLTEMLLFTAAAVSLLEAKNPEGPSPVVLALVIILVAKAGALFAVNILAPRTKPDRMERRPLLWKLAIAGGALSVLALAGGATASTRLQPRLDHDLDLTLALQDSGWKGSRKAADWEVFKDNHDTRSEWTHSSGLLVTVFAYPLGVLESPAEFRRDFEAAMRGKEKSTLLRADEKLPGAFQGFRQIRQSAGQDGRPVATLQYFVYDTAGNDVHQVITAVPAEQAPLAEKLLEDFLTRARFIDAVPPER